MFYGDTSPGRKIPPVRRGPWTTYELPIAGEWGWPIGTLVVKQLNAGGLVGEESGITGRLVLRGDALDRS